MNQMDWRKKRIGDLQELVALLSSGNMRSIEQIGDGPKTDITQRSIDEWNAQIAALRNTVEDVNRNA